LSRPAVAARGLVCQFGPVRAVEDLSFEVAEGEVAGAQHPLLPGVALLDPRVRPS
jgi:ABC-type branched-subunit amino acid transport system ATPase component